jgi:hypothetical protein
MAIELSRSRAGWQTTTTEFGLAPEVGEVEGGRAGRSSQVVRSEATVGDHVPGYSGRQSGKRQHCTKKGKDSEGRTPLPGWSLDVLSGAKKLTRQLVHYCGETGRRIGSGAVVSDTQSSGEHVHARGRRRDDAGVDDAGVRRTADLFR